MFRLLKLIRYKYKFKYKFILLFQSDFPLIQSDFPLWYSEHWKELMNGVPNEKIELVRT